MTDDTITRLSDGDRRGSGSNRNLVGLTLVALAIIVVGGGLPGVSAQVAPADTARYDSQGTPDIWIRIPDQGIDPGTAVQTREAEDWFEAASFEWGLQESSEPGVLTELTGIFVELTDTRLVPQVWGLHDDGNLELDLEVCAPPVIAAEVPVPGTCSFRLQTTVQLGSVGRRGGEAGFVEFLPVPDALTTITHRVPVSPTRSRVTSLTARFPFSSGVERSDNEQDIPVDTLQLGPPANARMRTPSIEGALPTRPGSIAVRDPEFSLQRSTRPPETGHDQGDVELGTVFGPASSGLLQSAISQNPFANEGEGSAQIHTECRTVNQAGDVDCASRTDLVRPVVRQFRMTEQGEEWLIRTERQTWRWTDPEGGNVFTDSFPAATP